MRRIKYNFIFLILIVIIIFFLILFLNIKEKNGIPRKIWTYWNNKDDIPEIVLRCVETWREENRDYSIEILDIKKIKELMGVDIKEFNIDESFFARHSDIARLLIIAKYGGIWLDATIICTESLSWVSDIQERENVEFIGYIAPHTTNNKSPIIENWFLAAIPGSNFIKDWLVESIYMTSFESESSYIESVRDDGIDIQNLDPYLPYLTIHLCGTTVLQRANKMYKLFLMDPRYENGPFKYLEKNDWDTERSLNALCNEKDLETPLIKLRGSERRYLQENSIKCNLGSNKNILNVLYNN